jgi:hypothetical protein
MSDRTAMTEARPEGFYWVFLGQNPPEIASWERGGPRSTTDIVEAPHALRDVADRRK